MNKISQTSWFVLGALEQFYRGFCFCLNLDKGKNLACDSQTRVHKNHLRV